MQGRTEAGSDSEALLAIGEAKWNETMGLGHLERLRHIVGLVVGRGDATPGQTRLMCFSGAGFTRELREAATGDRTVHLIGLERLYLGG